MNDVKLSKNKSDVKSLEFEYCRSCYGHLAGQVGTALADALLKQQIIAYADGKFRITPKGLDFFLKQDIDMDSLQNNHKSLIKTCVDVTERRHHIAGPIGDALLNKFLKLNYLSRVENSRVIEVTKMGREAFEEEYFMKI